MKRHISPAEKKSLSYQKDYVNASEYPHIHRRQWPVVKARANRKQRREARELLSKAPRAAAPLIIDDVPEPMIRTELIKTKRPWYPMPLGEALAHRRRRRAHKELLHFMQSPYQSEFHRKRFVAFLEAHTKSHSAYARVLARLLTDKDYQQRWLQAFFRDEPEWKERLQTWQASFPVEEP